MNQNALFASYYLQSLTGFTSFTIVNNLVMILTTY